MKIKKISMHNIFEGLKKVINRFPVPTIFSLITTVFLIIQIETDYNWQYKDHLLKAVFLSILGFLISLSVKLFSEKKEFALKKRSIINIITIAFLVYLYFVLPAKFRERDFIVITMFYVSTFMSLMFVYLRKEDSEPDFGRYNVEMVIRITVSAIFANILFAGVGSAVFAIEELFDLGFKGDIYGEIFVTASTLFAPLYFLAGVPDRTERSLSSYEFPKAIKVLTLYILLPLVIGYIGILYIYMFKVIFTQDWPKGIVSYLVISYSFVGINSLILSAPLNTNDKYKGLKTYTKYFFRALIPLIIMLFFAISKRIDQYGMTEKRYFILLLAFWLLGVSIYYVFRKDAKLKYLPVSLAIVSLLSLFGPWSCFNISMSSQEGRLEKLLTENDILVNGNIVKAIPGKITFEDRKSISSIISYFYDTHGIDKVDFLTQTIEKLNADTTEKNNKEYEFYRDKGLTVSRKRLVKEGFGFTFIDRWQTALTGEKDYITFDVYSGDKTFSIDIKNYDYMIDYSTYKKDSIKINNKLSAEFLRDSMQIVFKTDKKNIKVDLDLLLKKFLEGKEVIDRYNHLTSEEMMITDENDSISYKILLRQFSYNTERDSITKVNYPTFTMYFKLIEN